jgi:hypothetical protein
MRVTKRIWPVFFVNCVVIIFPRSMTFYDDSLEACRKLPPEPLRTFYTGHFPLLTHISISQNRLELHFHAYARVREGNEASSPG